ncbi:MAG: Fe-S-containing hydro-lyase [Candidatus Eremiobacteraeota bacterium]|nr:Fe-S-containing hydro-lyase [Candidatus Eremiobacteraeota bacterium]
MKNPSTRLTLPLTLEAVKALRAGMNVTLEGELLVARDTAHKRLYEALEKKEKLPVSLKDQTIYYMGPSPARPGQVIGAAGPTTSGRMDFYTPRLLAEGVRGLIGKGERSKEVKEALVSYQAIYFSAIGGIGALLSKKIKEVNILAYEDLGAEALRLIRVSDFPAVVVLDTYGGNLYEEGRRSYKTL